MFIVFFSVLITNAWILSMQASWTFARAGNSYCSATWLGATFAAQPTDLLILSLWQIS